MQGLFKTISIIVALCIVLGMCMSRMKTPTAPASTSVTAKPRPAVSDADMAYFAITLAREKVPTSMRDAKSAEFRDLFTVKTPGGGFLVCGEVNGNNAFGGKAVFHKFMFNTEITILEESMKPREFIKAWNGSCAKWPQVASAKS